MELQSPRAAARALFTIVLCLAAWPALAARPNLILILTDDETAQDMVALPWTQKLLRDQGVEFSNSFVSWSLCCPSRTTTLTGEYAHNHHVLGNGPPSGGAGAFTNDAETLPVWLQRAGYRTVHIGKYLNGYGADSRGPTYVPPGWSDWNALVDPRAYVMWGYQINHSGALSTYGQFKVEDPALYQTDVLKQIALDAITAAAGKPFFLNFDVVAPHDEMLEGSALSSPMTGPRPAPRHAGVYANTALPHPPNFLEPDLSDKPAFVSQFAAATGHETISQLTSRYRRRLESLRAVDDAVFAIVARLKALNLLDNTYIVFTSDNGWFNGEHGIHSNKFLMYEPSIRVPMYIRGPGLAHGTSDELVANVDLAATFLDLAGASAGRAIDGRSFVPYARDTTLHSKRPILLDAPLEQRLPIAPNSPAVVAVPAMRGLRTRRFVYVEHGTGEKELYDLQNDPYELASVHNKALYYTQRVELHAALMQYQKCAGDTCRMELMAPN